MTAESAFIRTRWASSTSLFWVSTAFVGITCLALAGRSVVLGTGWRELVLAEALLVAVLAVRPLMIPSQSNRTRDYLHPVILVSLTYIMVFAARPLFLLSPWAKYVDAVPTEVFNLLTFSESDTALALFYAVMGLVSFQMGSLHWEAQSTAPDQPPSRWSSPRVTRIAIVGTVWAGISAMLIWPVVGGWSGMISNFGMLRGLLAGYGYYSLGLDLLPVVVLVLWVDHLQGTPRPSLIPLMLASNVYNLLIGSRAGVFNLWLFMFLAHRYLKAERLRPRRLVLPVLLATALVFAIWVGVLRNQKVADWQDLGELSKVIWEATPAGAFFASAMLEFDQSDIFAAVIHAGSSNFPYLWGRSFFDLMLQPIPRVWWPNKTEAFDIDIGRYITGIQTAIPPSIVGELYLNFHIFGIVLGMFLFGRLACRFYAQSVSQPRQAGKVLLYSLVLPYVPLLLLRSFVGASTTAVALGIPAWLAVRYITQRDGAGN